MANDLTQYKGRLREYVETITRPSKKGFYCCPLCGSGTHGNNGRADGAFSIKRDGLTWHCFSCNAGGDIFDLIEQYEGVDKSEAARRVLEMYGPGRPISTGSTSAKVNKAMNWDSDLSPDAWADMPETKPASTSSASMGTNASAPAAGKEGSPTAKTAQGVIIPDYKAEIARYAAALPGSPGESYLTGRGFTRETMQRFHLGYDADKGGSIVIPYSANGVYYGRRACNNLKKGAGRYYYQTGTSIPIFNNAVLHAEGADIIFVTESPLCAISIMQAGGKAVALSGTNHNALLRELKEHGTEATLLLCLDNDEPGQEAEGKLAEGLDALGISYMSQIMPYIAQGETEPNAANYRKDPNECLQKDGPEAFKTIISDVITEAERIRATIAEEAAQKAEEEREAEEEAAAKAEEERRAITGAAAVDSFLQVVQSELYRPIPTGIKTVDTFLDGGFTRGTLVLLGAAPGTYKTGFASWILENMAMNGADVLYLNLEMPRDSLLARSIARITARMGYAVDSKQIKRGYAWTQQQREIILQAAEEYKQTIAPHMIYNPDGLSAELDKVLAAMEAEAERAEKANRQAPLVCIDYAQMLLGRPREEGSELMKRAMFSLKGYAMKHKTVVLCIVAHNRTANKSAGSGAGITMEAARDSSAFEYTADLQLGLVHTYSTKRLGTEPKAREDLTKEEQKYITLKVLKGREGGENNCLDMKAEGSTMTFTPLPPNQDRSNSYTMAAMQNAKPYRKGKN